jgi:hypothetical protein
VPVGDRYLRNFGLGTTVLIDCESVICTVSSYTPPSNPFGITRIPGCGCFGSVLSRTPECKSRYPRLDLALADTGPGPGGSWPGGASKMPDNPSSSRKARTSRVFVKHAEAFQMLSRYSSYRCPDQGPMSLRVRCSAFVKWRLYNAVPAPLHAMTQELH